MAKIIPLDGARLAFIDGLKQSAPRQEPAKKTTPAVQFDDSIDIPNEGPRPSFDDEIIPF